MYLLLKELENKTPSKIDEKKSSGQEEALTLAQQPRTTTKLG